jgi:hypothetical protein
VSSSEEHRLYCRDGPGARSSCCRLAKPVPKSSTDNPKPPSCSRRRAATALSSVASVRTLEAGVFRHPRHEVGDATHDRDTLMQKIRRVTGHVE